MNEQVPSKEQFSAVKDFDEWNEVTGALPNGTSWNYECRSIMEDADKEIELWRSRAQRINSLILRLNADEGLSAAALAGLQRLAASAGGATPESALRPDDMPAPSLELLKRVAARMPPDTAYLAEWAIKQIEARTSHEPPAECPACEEFVRMQHDIASILGVDEDTDSIGLHGRIYDALSTRAAQPPPAAPSNDGYWRCECGWSHRIDMHPARCPSCQRTRPDEDRASQPPSPGPLSKAACVFAGPVKESFILKLWFETQADLDAAFDLVEGSAGFVPMESSGPTKHSALTPDDICSKCNRRLGEHSAEPGRFMECPRSGEEVR